MAINTPVASAIVNTPVTSAEDIFICDMEADIRIEASLICTAGNVYVVGKNVLITAGVVLKAQNGNCHVVGVERSVNHGTILAEGSGVSAYLNLYEGPARLIQGRNISANVQRAIA